MTAKLLQIHFNVLDMERAIRFYVNALGMKFVERPLPQWATLTLGDLEIGLLQIEDPSQYLNRAPFGCRAGATITFTSEDIKADRKRLEEFGAISLKEEAQPWGHLLIFEDTEGNVLRLMKDTDDQAARLRQQEELRFEEGSLKSETVMGDL